MKHFNKLKEIKKTEGKIQEIKGFLSRKEIKKILNYKDKNPNYFVKRNDGWKISFNKINKKPIRSIDKWHPILKDTIYPKLKKIFPNTKFYVHKNEFPPHIFKSNYPLKIHADTGKDNKKEIPFKQILVPLYIDKNSQNVFTIFFKNRWYGPAANFRSKKTINDPLEITDNNNKFIRISDLKKFFLYLNKNKNKKLISFSKGRFRNDIIFRNKIKKLISKKRYNITTSKLINNKMSFPKKIYNKYLTHEDYEDFKGLKFWKAIKWKIGNAIIWDRSIVHSSNNFLKYKAYNKIGLSIFLNRK